MQSTLYNILLVSPSIFWGVFWLYYSFFIVVIILWPKLPLILMHSLDISGLLFCYILCYYIGKHQYICVTIGKHQKCSNAVIGFFHPRSWKSMHCKQYLVHALFTFLIFIIVDIKRQLLHTCNNNNNPTVIYAR